MIRALSFLILVGLVGCDSNDLDRTCDSDSYPVPPPVGNYGELEPGSSVVATRDGRYEGSSSIETASSFPTRYLSLHIGDRAVDLSSAVIDVDTVSAGGPYRFSAYFGTPPYRGEGSAAAVRVIRADADAIEGTFRACVASYNDLFNYTGPGSFVEGGFHVLRASSAADEAAAAVPTR